MACQSDIYKRVNTSKTQLNQFIKYKMSEVVTTTYDSTVD